MSFFVFSALVNSFTSTVIGLFVLSRGWRERVNLLFALFAFSVAGWSVGYTLWQLATNPATALFWCRVFMSIAVLIPFFYFHFIVVYLGIETRERALIAFGYLFAVVFSYLSFTEYFITGVRHLLSFPYWPIPGAFFTPFLCIWLFYVAYGTYILFAAYQATHGERRVRILTILIGMGVGFVGGITNYLLWYAIPIPPWGNILVSFYVIMVGYAIIQHKLFDIRVIATEMLMFALWFASFFRLLASKGTNDLGANAIFLAVSIVFGILLIRSVDREVEQRELIQAQEKELEAINAQQQNLLHFISHEIKGYLTKSEAVFASVIEGDFGEVSPRLDEIAHTALTDVRKGVATVMDILDASNLKKGTISFKKLPLDFRVLVMKIVEEQRPIADEKHLNFDVHIADGEYRMEGDEEKLREHVIRNLIDNAIKYTPQGTVRVELSDGNGKIRFMVQDSGVGITPEDMKRLFTEGGHGKDSIKVNVHSTGYGLFIAKQIVDAHGGKIWAETGGPGKGARFIVEFTV